MGDAQMAGGPGALNPGWAVEETGGGCLALRLEREDRSYYLITAGDDPKLPVVGEAAILGYYDPDGEVVWLRLIEAYSTPREAFDNRNLLEVIEGSPRETDGW